jgi:hypothetical protein
MANDLVKITREQAKEALLRSGYLLETRLEAVLRDSGYVVYPSDAVPDPRTGISREMDLYALKAFPLDHELGYIFEALLIECVNNANPLAFITREAQLAFLQAQEIKISGLPVKIPLSEPGRWVSLQDFLKMSTYHHYCRGTIATQWCSFTLKGKGGGNLKKEEWVATHDDQHFNDLGKLSAAVDYHTDKHIESWICGRKEIGVAIELYYPVLVVQGDLLEVHPSKRSLRLDSANHIQFRRSIVSAGEERRYQIDVVTERFFPKYLNMLKQELAKTGELLVQQTREVQDAIAQIIQASNQAKTPEEKYKAFVL